LVSTARCERDNLDEVNLQRRLRAEGPAEAKIVRVGEHR